MASLTPDWSALNRELEGFAAQIQAHAAAPAPPLGLTPARIGVLEELLRRGAAALATPAAASAPAAAARLQYATQMRALLPLLQQCQIQLNDYARRLEGDLQRLSSMRSWLDRQL